MIALRIICLGLMAAAGFSAEWLVGPSRTYTKPSQVAALVASGDTVSIDAGTYTNDVCIWSQSNLTLRGVGGMAKLSVGYNVVAGGKAIWVLSGGNITVQNIEFTGAALPWSGTASANAAGIRSEGAGLTITNCYFHDNQNGILSGANASSDILIENSEFAYNGYGDGYTHNLYIGAVRKLTFRYNYSHHAKVGQNLKSRALANYIIGNRIMDEATGTSSYVVDIPNGGLTYLIGNLIQQGNLSNNRSVIINYAEEGEVNPSQNIYVINNTIVNDYTGAGGTNFINLPNTPSVARIENNIFLGQGTAIVGTVTSNLRNLVTTTSPLVNRAGFDYRLLATATAAIDKAANPGTYEGQALLPTSQYVHPKGSQARTTVGAAPDIGAYEYAVANAAPVITEGTSTTLAVNEDVAGSKTLNATDADGDTLTWSILSQGAKGTATASGIGAAKSVGYTPTANQNGADSFVVQVSDGKGGTDTITVNVTITAVNDGPLLAALIPDQAATAGVAFSYTVPLATITDIDSTLTWSSNETLTWLSFNATTRVFSGTPGTGDVAATTITVTASDGSLSASDSFVLTVSAAPNVAPVITEGTSTTLAVNEDNAGSKTLNATDGNGDTLTWSILTQGTKGVATASGTGASKSVGYTPTANLNGADSFVVQVADGKGGTDTITVNVTITAVNDGPVLVTPIPDRTATVGVAFSYTVPLGTITDVDSTLTWSSNEALGWLSFNATTRVFSGTPAAGDVAATTITVTASDGSLSTSDSFVLTVSTAANTAPVIASATATPATVSGTSAALACSASDNAGESNLTYTWSASGPAAVTFSPNASNAAKAATATFARSGSYVLTVTALDSGALTATRTVNVTVAATPTSLVPSPSAISVTVGAQSVFSASARDQFGILLASQPVVAWTVSGGGSIDATGRFTAGTVVGGPWTVTATAGSLSGTSQVTVAPAGAAPAPTSSGSAGSGCGAGAIGLLLAASAMLGFRRRDRPGC